MHHKDAIHRGETEQRLHSLTAWRDCPWYSDAERAVLAYTDWNRFNKAFRTTPGTYRVGQFG
jgi:alkylhydroperoxidase family enzyme